MDQPAPLSCCFCKGIFKRLGNHYKNCPSRDGRDYQHLLSQKTIDKKAKAKKVPCPKCGKFFIRLETHLRNSATCKSTEVPQPSSPTALTLHHPYSPTHTPKSHYTSLSDSFVPSPPPLPSNPMHVSHPSPSSISPSPSPSSVSHPSFVPHHPDVLSSSVSHPSFVPHHPDVLSSPVSHPSNVPTSSVPLPFESHPSPIFVPLPPHEYTPCHMSFVHYNHACGTHPSHAHTHPTNPLQSSLTHASHLTPVITLTPPQSHHTHSSPPSQHAHSSITTPCQLHHGQEAPPTTSSSTNYDLLPPFSAPQSLSEWTQMDEYLSEHVIPVVLQADNVEDMSTLLSRGIQVFLSSNYPAHTHNTSGKSKSMKQTHQRALKAARDEKTAVKKQLRALRRRNDDLEEVRALATRFHQLVRRHCKLVREEKRKERTSTMQQQRRRCHRNFWRFANELFNDDSSSDVEPAFEVDAAEAFFTKAYESRPATFERPTWMKPPQAPTTPLHMDTITTEEIQHVLKKCRPSSSPCPVDQISYSVLKNCASLIPALLRLYNLCWTTKCVPSQWKVGVIKLLGKPAAQQDPSSPSNFRPIALTSCLGKVYTSILKQRWQHFMVSNGYLNTTIQKAFVDGIPGCSEHHLKLLAMLEEARTKHKSIAICWLDIANAYGSVHHNLIRFALDHYHAPAHFTDIISNLYTGLTGIVRTKQWTSSPFHLGIGVFQGDPLSVSIFNTVMNTLVDTLSEHKNMGYTFTKSLHTCNHLQYADDTCLIGDGPASCQALLEKTQQWLQWAGLKAKIPKCASLAFQASTGKGYDPSLTLQGDTIPFIGESTFRFLGSPISTSDTTAEQRGALLLKLETMLKKVDETLLTSQQKLHLYSHGICPRLVWDMSITKLSISWVTKNLEALATRFLKRWAGLARCAAIHRLYLPKSSGGLHLPSLTTIFKKTKCGLAASQMNSRDSTVRLIADRQTTAESKASRATFKPHQEVVAAMKDDPGSSRPQIIRTVKRRVTAADNTRRLESCRQLAVQGDPSRRFDDRASTIWAEALWDLPERVMKFTLNAAQDTLPHNANLHLWKKLPTPNCPLCSNRQTLLHVLNNCPVALQNRRYNQRHDAVLKQLYQFVISHASPQQQVTVDLPDQEYCFPASFAATDSRPDMVIWSQSSIHLVELTIPFETTIEDAARRKRDRYQDLLTECSATSTANLITIEVGSRGFLHLVSLQELYKALDHPPSRECRRLEEELVKTVLHHSHLIWCKRNWRQAEGTETS